MIGSVMVSAGEQLATKVPDLAQLQKMTARFAPTELDVDTSNLSQGDRKALVKLVEAARIIDDIFMTQYWSGDRALYARLQKDTSSLGKARLHYFWINKSPWSSLDSNTAFIAGVPEHNPPGANFYPESMTKEQFDSWVKMLSEKQQEQAKGFFTVIRSDGKGFTIVPFSEAYKDDLTRAANLLREAASLTDNATLKRFLTTRAAAFLSNDYYESDVAWMDLDAPLDPTRPRSRNVNSIPSLRCQSSPQSWLRGASQKPTVFTPNSACLGSLRPDSVPWPAPQTAPSGRPLQPPANGKCPRRMSWNARDRWEWRATPHQTPKIRNFAVGET